LSALDSAHAALALGCPTLLVARMSAGDPRERHRGISHHTLTVLELLLEPVSVALPASFPVPRELEAELGVGVDRAGRIGRHDWRLTEVDLAGYSASGLPAETMGRSLREDPLFFAAALAGGTVLAGLAGPGGPGRRASGGEKARSRSDEGALLADAKPQV
jgi:hypothetical protein